MLFSVEAVSPERAFEIVCHVFTFTIYTFEYMRAWGALSCFELWWVELWVGFAAPCHISMVLKFMGSITFLTFGSMSSARESQMTPFPEVVALGDAWIHVHGSNSCNKSTKIERMVD